MFISSQQGELRLIIAALLGAVRRSKIINRYQLRLFYISCKPSKEGSQTVRRIKIWMLISDRNDNRDFFTEGSRYQLMILVLPAKELYIIRLPNSLCRTSLASDNFFIDQCLFNHAKEKWNVIVTWESKLKFKQKTLKMKLI